MGAKFNFNGEKLTEKNRTTTIASARGNKIFAKTSYSATANIKGSKIYDGNSTAKVVANVRNGYLCSENSSSKAILNCEICSSFKTSFSKKKPYFS